MILLVDLEASRVQLNDDVIDESSLIHLVEMASAVVLGEIRDEYPDSWEVEGSSPVMYDIPGRVQIATFLVMGEFHQNREASAADVLSATVIQLLAPYRDPTCV